MGVSGNVRKNCLICGGEFEGHGRQLYCSEACKRKARLPQTQQAKRRKKECRAAGGAVWADAAERRCPRCRYYNQRERCCDHLAITRRSRLALHWGEAGSINDPCREFEEARNGPRKNCR